MTSKSNDITFLLTSDGQDWLRYLRKRLQEIPEVTHEVTQSSIVLDVPEEGETAACRVASACRRSAVTVLLATHGLAQWLEDQAEWMTQTLQQVPSTSALVALLLLERDRQEYLDNITQKYGYVTSNWKYMDAGHEVSEVRERIADVLNIVEQCRADKEKAGCARVSRGPVEFFPSTVYQTGVRVALVFKEEVRGEVTLKLEQTEVSLATKRETSTVFTFSAPLVPPGKYRVLVYVNKQRQRGCRPELTFHGVEMAAFTSPYYLAQTLGLSGLPQLDQHLKDTFTASLPTEGVLKDLFRALPDPGASEQGRNADTRYPTLLHYAAAHGLSEFCAAILECQGSDRAFRIRNCDGQDPAGLAAGEGFDELEDYILSFMDMQQGLKEIYSHYMDMNLTAGHLPAAETRAATSGLTSEQDYMTITDIGRDARSLSVPALPPRVDPQQDLSLTDKLADRAPMPPPRSKNRGLNRSTSHRHHSAPTLPEFTVEEREQRATTLPPGARLDAKAFMGMDDTDHYTQTLPDAAMGSRNLSELIQLQNEVKAKELTLPQAQSLFRSWQSRQRTQSASFKDRQREMAKLKKDLMVMTETESEQATQSRGLLSFLGLGGRQRTPDVELQISDPVDRKGKLPPRTYVRSASTGQALPPLTAQEDPTDHNRASVASRDSGCSRSEGSRDSSQSIGIEETEREGDDVFDEADYSVMHRPNRSVRASPLNRLSLGVLYLQQADRQTTSGEDLPPSLPPRSRSGPVPVNLPPLPPLPEVRARSTSSVSEEETSATRL